MNPKVSIVIPCFNEDKYIRRAIQSALDQSFSSKEIIVVDDGSNQKTREILKQLEPSINLLITQKNQGVIAARNNGISQARGEYILTLDADDYFDPEFLINAVPVLESETQIGMVTCWFEVTNELTNIKRLIKPTGASAFIALFHNNAPASLLFRKKCWLEVGGYDNKLQNGYEDWEFNIAVGAKGWQVHVFPKVLFNYTNRIGSRNKKARNFYPEIRKYTYKKHKKLLVENFDKTLEFFLSEIETKDREIFRIRNSNPYKFSHSLLKPFQKLKSFFS